MRKKNVRWLYLTIDALIGLDPDNQLIPHTLALHPKWWVLDEKKKVGAQISKISSGWPWRCLQIISKIISKIKYELKFLLADLEDVSRHILVLDPDLSLSLVQSFATFQDEGHSVPPKGQGLKFWNWCLFHKKNSLFFAFFLLTKHLSLLILRTAEAKVGHIEPSGTVGS